MKMIKVKTADADMVAFTTDRLEKAEAGVLQCSRFLVRIRKDLKTVTQDPGFARGKDSFLVTLNDIKSILKECEREADAIIKGLK